MKISYYAAIFLGITLTAGCAANGKFIGTRGMLDESIFYNEKDTSNSLYTISSSTYAPNNNFAKQVPYPAFVDMNSTIQILLVKDRIKQGSGTGKIAKQSEELLTRKTTIAKALAMLGEVVQARKQVIETYKKEDLTQFYEAKKRAATTERKLLSNLMTLWPDNAEEYSRLEEAYDPPLFGNLQEFLRKQIETIEATNQKIEDELKTRQRTLSLEAFLYSPGKDPVAVHLDGYDYIKEETLARRDRFGLDLSKEERQRLDDHVSATQEVAASLERLRQGESTLNEEVRKTRSLMLPEIESFVDDAQRLYNKIQPARLNERQAETKKYMDAYLDAIKKKNTVLYESKKGELESDRNAALSHIRSTGDEFSKAVESWIASGKSLAQDWKNATPASMFGMVDQTVKVLKSVDALKAKLPEVAADAQKKSLEFVEQYVKDADQVERDILLKSDEAQVLRNNLEGYYRDFRESYDLLARAVASLSRGELQPIVEMPPATVSFQVPLENIKDSFIDLEATPRLPDDVITVKATLKDETTVVDTSSAKFQIARFGHYAELSPAVVLIKPDQLSGGDDGFRFAPLLSWMHHWFPRPGDTSTIASAFRAFDPAIGIHSAFTNFRSDTSHDPVQIGLGITLSFWKNRLQFGAGENLMAAQRDQGRYYFFIGSDLIGLLQTVGIAKQ